MSDGASAPVNHRPGHKSGQRKCILTRHEFLTIRADSLAEKGRNSPPGIREQLFLEAEDIRVQISNMSVEDAADIIPPCKGPDCTDRNCGECLSRGIRE